MATLATMAMLGTKCPAPKPSSPTKPAVSLLSLQNLPKGLAAAPPKPTTLTVATPSSFTAATAIAGAIFAGLSTSDAALAAQQIADIAAEGGDSRGLALLIPIAPAILWVLYNILQPALNQLNRMRTEKAVVAGLGIGGALAAAGLVSAPGASADELAAIAAAAARDDSRGLLVLIVVAPAILWVLYNILQPALNQLNRMRSG